MFKTFFTLLVLVFSITVYGQADSSKNGDIGRIVINTFVPDQIQGLTPTAKNSLENKLSQISTANGMGGSSLNPRFILTANVVVLSKDITPTAPPMHNYTLEITMYIGDGIEGTKFASHSVTLTGVGENETKAYLAALKNLKVKDPQYQTFLEEGKKRIVEYYNAKCDFIMKEAEMLVSRNEFDAAIYKLVGIPEVCKECYDKAMDAVTIIYQKQIDFECTKQLFHAKNVWIEGLDANAADKASQFLAEISPNSKCFPDATTLTNEIMKRLKELDQREWNFKLKQQQDDTNRQLAAINAAKEIGVAYGKNQPRTVTYNYRGWW